MLRNFAQLQGAGTPFDWVEAIGFGRQPFSSYIAGPFQVVAGPNGAAIGCLGWVDPDSGQVSNSLIPGALMGFVLPLADSYNLWERAFIRRCYPFPQMIVRPGVACVVASSGDMRAKFPDGGQAGSRVYADPRTGLPYAIPDPTLVPVSMDDALVTMDSTNVTMDQSAYIKTSWTLCQSGCPGARLRISSFVQPFNS